MSGSVVVDSLLILEADATSTSGDVAAALSDGFPEGYGIDPEGTQISGESRILTLKRLMFEK